MPARVAGAQFAGGGAVGYTVGTWRTTNLPASTTVSPNRATGLGAFWPAPRDVVITRVAFEFDAAVGVGSSALSVRASVNGGADVELVSIANADGADGFKVVASPLSVPGGQTVQIRFVTDGSWTSTTLDPSVEIEVQES